MWRNYLACVLLAVGMMGCDSASPPATQGPRYSQVAGGPTKPVYRLAIHPLHNPQKLTEAYQPLIDHLNRQFADVQFMLEASRDYQAYEEKFRQRGPELLLPNPWQTLEAVKKGYQVIAMAGDAEDFRGIFIVRKDSPIRQPADLKGKAVSYPSPTALAAAMLPQYFLHTHGLRVTSEIDNRYVGSQESSIMNVYLRQVAAGATWPPPWRAFVRDHPKEAAELHVIWETPSLLNNSVMVRDDVPTVLRDRLQVLLLSLAESAEGREILEGMQTARFHRADNAFYQPVARFIERFEQDVRPVESR